MRDYKRPAAPSHRPDNRKNRGLLRVALVFGLVAGLLWWAASAFFKREPAQPAPVVPLPTPTTLPKAAAPNPREAPARELIETALPAPLLNQPVKTQSKPAAAPPAPVRKKKKRPAVPETPERAYEFYELLPKMEVKIEPETPATASPLPIAPTLSASPDAAEGAAPVDAPEDKAGAVNR